MSRTADADRPRAWTLWLFRIVVGVEAFLALGQAALAGSYLSGNYDALNLHAVNAALTSGVGGLMTVAAVLLWRPGRGPGWPAIACLVLVGSEGLQTALGASRVMALHIPLGTAIVAAIALMLRWAWRTPVAAADPDPGREPVSDRMRETA